MKASIAVALSCALSILSPSVVAAEAETAPTHEQVSKIKEFLFVQNASSGSVSDGRLTLKAAGPVIFFSDRPYRVFGHTQLKHFIDSWNTGMDSFDEDPPNGVLSILGDKVSSFGVVLSAPRLEADGKVSYQVEVEQGELPAQFGPASLFIDNEAWAAVGGLVVGRHMARRHQEEQKAAYAQGEQAAAAQNENTYYHASPAAAPAGSAAKSSDTPEQQLTELQDLLEKGLISQDDYNKKKQQILQAL